MTDTIAEEVLCKHKEEGASIQELAIANAIETVNVGELVDVYNFKAPAAPETHYVKIATQYIYDDDSYTTILTNEQHVTGHNLEVDEYTAMCVDYNYAKQSVFYEHGSNDEEIQPQGRSPTKDPIIRNAISKRKAILLYCAKFYNKNRTTMTDFPAIASELENPLL
jgi:hypothetical protein